MKMEDLQCKARMVAGGHMTDVLLSIMYASEIYRETVRVVLMMALSSGMSVKTGDIMNAYIKATCG